MGIAKKQLLILDASFSYAVRSVWQSVKKAITEQVFEYEFGIVEFYRQTREMAQFAGLGEWKQFYSNVKNNLALNGLESYKELYLETKKVLNSEGMEFFKRFFTLLAPLVEGYAAIDSMSVKAFYTLNDLSGIILGSLREKGLEAFKKEFNNHGVQVPYEKIKHLLPQAVVDFMGHYSQDSYNSSFYFTIHRAVEDKREIGCPTERIAETIIYADKDGNNNFFVFTRLADDFQIPRAIIKTVIGHKDLAKAAKLAEENLMNECHTGVMGPFFIKPGDKVFFDANTMDYFADTSRQFVNFSAGTLMKSVYLSLPSAVDVFRKHNNGQTHITEIHDAEKFKIFYKNVVAPSKAKGAAKDMAGKQKIQPSLLK